MTTPMTPELRLLDADSTVATLACHLPAGVTLLQAPDHGWDARQIAEFLAEHLAVAGYGLVELGAARRERPVLWREPGGGSAG